MRLPLRHPPPGRDAPQHRCRHLEALAEAARGLPLGPAADALTHARGRGRHGNALQWHFGLDVHDTAPTPDWEGRIEIKLVSVWQRADGRLSCDRIKVCEVSVDPWAKLGNVLFVFADRLSRVVLGHRFFHAAGRGRVVLEQAWMADPHFDRPALVLESRDGPEGMLPAYYLAAWWLAGEGLLPSEPVEIGYGFRSAWWRAIRAEHDGLSPMSRSPAHQSCGGVRTRLGACDPHDAARSHVRAARPRRDRSTTPAGARVCQRRRAVRRRRGPHGGESAVAARRPGARTRRSRPLSR
jgi:hypothetical protein